MRKIYKFALGLGVLVLLSSATVFAQSVTVSGTVTEADSDNPLPGANVIEKGTFNGTVTNVDGEYTITVKEGATLVFSFIGYESQEISVDGRTSIDISLDLDQVSLEEVVVVGYGTTRKSDLTGAVSLADPEEMQKQAATDLTQQLQGRVAGVAITQDGQPGASPNVRIRGVSTFGGGGATAEPLYVVDGTPLTGGIRDINPNDIESIQVLKDATAGAIYGNRAANGVVIITTKKGDASKPFSIGFNMYAGIQTVPDRIPVLDRVGFQTIQNEVMSNAGAALIPGNDPSSPSFIDDIDTDWQDAGYQDGSIVNYNLNFSGGSESTRYYVSADYLNNEGTLVGAGPNYERYSFRVNSETNVGRVKFGENFFKMRSNENPLFFTTTIALPGGRPSLVNDLLIAAPTIPVYDDSREGGFGGADAIIHNSITLNVPGINTLVEPSTVVDRTLVNLYAQVELIDGLNFKTNFSFDQTAITDELFVPQYDLGYFFPGPVASYQVGTRNSSSLLWENTLNYEKRFDKHGLKVLLGQSYQEDEFRNVVSTGTGLEKPYVKSLLSATEFSVSDNIQNSALYSFFGRLNYDFDDRYLITFNVRRDGSSRFAEENRYETFPSVGVAWKVHNDFSLPAFISDLKIRGGYGTVGNQFIGNYAYQGTVNRGIPYQFGGNRVFGGAVTAAIDPSIQWETRITRNVGMDAVFLDGRMEFTAEYYQNTSEDVLIPLPIPLSVGTAAGSSIITNAGSIENRGIELALSYRQSFGDFNIEISPNFYTVKNEILDLDILDNLPGTGTWNEVGRSIGEHYGWVFDGIFQSDQEVADHATQFPGTSVGDVRFKDIAGPVDANGMPTGPDGIVDDNDRTYLGQGLPTYYYGINIVMSYKGFDFTIFGSGAGGNEINSNLYRGLMPTTGFTNWHEDILDRWTPENPSNTTPRMIWTDPNNNGRNSNRPGWLQDGDYFRINTISLGYTFPSKILNAIKANRLRVYATMQNVVTFTKYKGYNPDFNAGILNPGFDFGTFPRPRTTMVGLQLKF